MSEWHQRPAADWPTNGGQSTGHLGDDLMMHLLRNQSEHTRLLSAFTAEVRGHMADTRSRLTKLEKARTERKMAQSFGLKDLAAIIKAALPWVVPVYMFVRALLGQVPWASFVEVLSKLGESGAVH